MSNLNMSSKGEWSRAFFAEFIELYRSHPCLWRIRSREYNDRNKKRMAYDRLVEKYREVYPRATRETVCRKINCFRTVYRKEYVKVRRSKLLEAGGDGAYEPYVPSLWYYDLLSFLSDDVKKEDATRQSHADAVEEFISTKEENSSDQDILSSPSPELQRMTNSVSTKRPHEPPNGNGNAKRQLLDQAMSILLNEDKEEDECDLYGKLVAMKLRKFSDAERYDLMHDIDAVILKETRRIRNAHNNDY